MEILDLRHFASHDLRPLLQHESREWLRLMQWEYSSSAEMILRYVDAKILPGYAAVEDKRVVGYSFFVYEGSKGVIGDLYVERRAHGHTCEMEHQLLTHVIETLQQSPGINRVEAQLLVHDSGTVSAPFVQEGFRRFPRVFMTLPLDKPRNGQHNGGEIEIRPWSEQDFQGAAAIITAAYRGHVDSEINDQYRNITGALRFLNNIVRFPGCGVFDGQSSFVAIHKPTKTMVGVLLCSRVKNDVGHITQVCVLPDMRGHGLGQRMIADCARELAKRNFSSLTLTVTEANTRAVELYKHLGFDSKRSFDAFVWEG